ncbi:beta-carotene 15,15'-monooxygenase, Brp/Blh family [Pricia antarctica]|uniref:Probable beta-carotene 15,15'-dioxygenase n=1 Tax=Pricia antarctica TaxID=641691 RepID=A0A1G7H9N6_9FLAO|nr:Brp/Blh family beta-carotene 15,15'-dioxygenase [Pricia antarctica]SDE97033.1 beta-carotene 15,15'-monooxygenase, Brp/Blh family [Pricia antarctica]
MKNLRQIAILASFFCIWLTSYIHGEYEIILSFFLILSFGILHGSNDIFLISKIWESGPLTSYGRVLSFYVVFVLLALGLFYFAPIVALSIFILCSAYHFGEQHWENDFTLVEGIWKRFFYLLYGMFILSLLFWLKNEEVNEVVVAISGYDVSEAFISYVFYSDLIVLVPLWLFLIVRDNIVRKQVLAELFYLVIFTIIFKVSSLIWGFAIYFVFWHSLPSLYDQIYFLNNRVDKKGVWDYWKMALPFWLISVIGIVALYYVFKDLEIFYALFFSFLAAVTFPHSIAIHKMFKTRNSKNDRI